MPKRKKQQRKNYRPVSHARMAEWSSGRGFFPSHRSLDPEALRDAINATSDAEARQIATADQTQCLRWADTFAARYPDDPRWDDWRTYRQRIKSHAN